MTRRAQYESSNAQALLELFSENVLAKVLRVAIEALENNVTSIQLCPSTLPNYSRYHRRYTQSLFPSTAQAQGATFSVTRTSGPAAFSRVSCILFGNAQSDIHRSFPILSMRWEIHLTRVNLYGSNSCLFATPGRAPSKL